MTIIEPCCAERQVTGFLKERRTALLQTNGDVTLAKWMQAILLLAGQERPRTMTLFIGEGLTAEVTKAVGKYLRLEWIAKLRLLTPTPLTADDVKRLSIACDCKVADLLERMELAAEWPSPQPGSFTDMLMMQGQNGTVVIQGPMTGTKRNAFTLYAAMYGKAESSAVNQFTGPANAHFRARKYEIDRVVADAPQNPTKSE